VAAGVRSNRHDGRGGGTGNWTAGLSMQGVGGVQIAEVAVDTETGVVHCQRFVAVGRTAA